MNLNIESLVWNRKLIRYTLVLMNHLKTSKNKKLRKMLSIFFNKSPLNSKITFQKCSSRYLESWIKVLPTTTIDWPNKLNYIKMQWFNSLTWHSMPVRKWWNLEGKNWSILKKPTTVWIDCYKWENNGKTKGRKISIILGPKCFQISWTKGTS